MEANQFNHAHVLTLVSQLRAKYLRKLNILKILSHLKTGCNSKILLPLYQSLIRSVLDCGSAIYGLAPPSQLAILDTIQKSAIRFITGALCTSPAVSLCVEVGIPPLNFRRLTPLTAEFLTTVLQFPEILQGIHFFPTIIFPDISRFSRPIFQFFQSDF